MSVFPHVFVYKRRAPAHTPWCHWTSEFYKMEGLVMSLNQCALKMELRFFENAQLVSKEWEIANLEVVPDDNPEFKKWNLPLDEVK